MGAEQPLILVIDDNVVSQWEISKALEHQGYQVKEVPIDMGMGASHSAFLTAQRMVEALAQGGKNIDLILTNDLMGSWLRVAAMGRELAIPVLIFTDNEYWDEHIRLNNEEPVPSETSRRPEMFERVKQVLTTA